MNVTSSYVVTGTDATAAQYNALRADLLSLLPKKSQFVLQESDNSIILGSGGSLMLQKYSLLAAPNGTTFVLRDSYTDYEPLFSLSTSTVSGLTITPAVCCRYLDGSTEYAIAFAAGGTTPYRYANDLTGEASMTFSGTAVTTGAQRIGWDPLTGYVYIMDAASLAGTAIKRYTVSGTVLTYVDTITLSVAPANAGSLVMWVGASNLAIQDAVTNARGVWQRYGKTTGTQGNSFTFGYSDGTGQYAIKTVCIGFNNECYQACAQIRANSGIPQTGIMFSDISGGLTNKP